MKVLIQTCAIVLTVVATSSGIAESRVRTIAVPMGDEPATAKCDSDGVIHLLINSPSGPRYSKSMDNGDTFSTTVPITDEKTKKSDLKFTVWDMSIGQDHRVHVVMGCNAWELKRPKEEWACYYTRLDPDAPSFSPVQNINRQSSE